MEQSTKYYIVPETTSANLSTLLGEQYEETQDLSKAEIVFIRTKTQLKTETDFDTMPNCKILGFLSTNPKNINIELASKRGILIFGAKGGNAYSVARTAMLYIECVLHNLFQARAFTQKYPISDDARREVELLKNKFRGNVFNDTQSMLVIGYGEVGKRVAKEAHQYGMTVYVNDLPSVLENVAGKKIIPVHDEEIINVIHTCDFITSHSSGEGIKLAREVIKRAKVNSIWADLARGNTYHLRSIAEFIPELNLRHITDFCGRKQLEMQRDHENNVFCLPHLAGETVHANDMCADMVVKAILSYRATSSVSPSCINPDCINVIA